MRLSDASAEFLRGYFSTHKRSKKTETAYRCDLAQFLAFVGEDLGLSSLDSIVVESWR